MNGVMELLPPPLLDYLHERAGLGSGPVFSLVLARAFGLHAFHRLVQAARKDDDTRSDEYPGAEEEKARTKKVDPDPGLRMIRGLLKHNQIDVAVNWAEETTFDTEEPVIVVANHPHGILDGLVLMSQLESKEKASRMLGSLLTSGVRELAPKTVLIDPYHDSKARHRNSKELREAFRFLRLGGLLVAFPSGAVEYRGLRDRVAREAAWNPSIARMARLTGATVVPAYIGGGNGWLFHLLSNAKPEIRIALMIRAFLARRGSRISVAFGPKISAEEIRGICANNVTDEETGIDTALISLFQQRCYALRGSCQQ